MADQTLKGMRVAILVADEFEQVEMTEPRKALEQAGAETKLIATQRGQVFAMHHDDEKGDAFQDLEFILDRVTPLYKHRMDDLSPWQQKIVDAIALNWDAMATKEITEKIRMESKAVSSQLKQLEKNRIIHKIKTSTKNHLYHRTEPYET